MTALVAQLVAVACAELGLAPAVSQILVTAAVNLAAQVPMQKLEAVIFAVMREGAKWLITRQPGPEPTPEFGGNTAAPSEWVGEPVERRPEPEDTRKIEDPEP